MNYKILIITGLISFALSAGISPFAIPILQRIKAGQTVRDDGPQSHLKKNGTPTMGGIMILIGFSIACLVMASYDRLVIPVLLSTLGFGVIGFIDDFIKVVLKRSMGLKSYQKFGLQIVLSIALLFLLTNYYGIDFAMKVPFMNGVYLNVGFLSIPLMVFIMVGTVNGSNFTDGLDGLASSVTVVISAFFAIAAILLGKGTAISSVAMAGALIGFLIYNTHPASVFMGDTGSLALGGMVSMTAIVLQMPLYLIIVAFIYFAEVLSVIIQVSYFKATGGKRVFKMAPIHHHFELCGYAETKVVSGFSIVSVALLMLAMLGIW